MCELCWKGVEEFSNMECPFCRKRLHIWLRRHAKTGVVDEELWKSIQAQYPAELLRLEFEEDPTRNSQHEGAGSVNGTPDGAAGLAHAPPAASIKPMFAEEMDLPKRQIAAEGEIQKEYKEKLKKFVRSRQEQAERDEIASKAILEKFAEEQKETAEKRRLADEQAAADAALAKKLQAEAEQQQQQQHRRASVGDGTAGAGYAARGAVGGGGLSEMAASKVRARNRKSAQSSGAAGLSSGGKRRKTSSARLPSPGTRQKGISNWVVRRQSNDRWEDDEPPGGFIHSCPICLDKIQGLSNLKIHVSSCVGSLDNNNNDDDDDNDNVDSDDNGGGIDGSEGGAADSEGENGVSASVLICGGGGGGGGGGRQETPEVFSRQHTLNGVKKSKGKGKEKAKDVVLTEADLLYGLPPSPLPAHLLSPTYEATQDDWAAAAASAVGDDHRMHGGGRRASAAAAAEQPLSCPLCLAPFLDLSKLTLHASACTGVAPPRNYSQTTAPTVEGSKPAGQVESSGSTDTNSIHAAGSIQRRAAPVPLPPAAAAPAPASKTSKNHLSTDAAAKSANTLDRWMSGSSFGTC